MRTIDWVDGEIHLIDQTRLPDELVVLRIRELDPLVDAIRGWPSAARRRWAWRAGSASRCSPPGTRTTTRPSGPAPQRLRAARPTAVNLAWGVDRALACLPDGPDGRAGRGGADPRRGHRRLRGHGDPRRGPDRRARRAAARSAR